MTGAVRLTLPMPVTRDVTWDAVRAYLRAEGWRRSRVCEEYGSEDWMRASVADGFVVFYTTADRGLERGVTDLARLASMSPGEMLARIADADDPAWTMVYGVRGRPCVWEHSDGRLEVRP